jgi:hypothetical protein
MSSGVVKITASYVRSCGINSRSGRTSKPPAYSREYSGTADVACPSS